MICIIDFDKTLFKNDFFKEAFVKKLIENPLKLFKHFIIERKDILTLKNELLAQITIQYSSEILINPTVKNWIIENRNNYDKMVVVSASPDFFIKQVLKDIDFIDEIHGSTTKNLKGENKLEYINNLWGDNFDYLGDSNSDIPIFKGAKNGFKITRKGLIHVKK